MSKFDDIATIQLLSNINEKKISNISEIKNKKKDISTEKNNCIAAVRYNTIGNAYKDRMNNIDVYLVKEEKNGNIKTHAYSRCSKTTQDGTNFCHLHCRMTKYNNDGLKIFEKDILPSNPNDKMRWLANVNDDFFENMGKRGAKKKNGENNYTFPDENHPVLLILTHKNAKLTTQLSLYASQLLKNSNYVCPEIMNNKDSDIKKTNSKKVKEVTKNNTSENISNLISMISTIDKSSELLKKPIIKEELENIKLELKEEEESLDDESEDEESEDEESEDEESENEVSKCEKLEKDDESIDNNSDDEGVSCIPIYTNKNKLLWYNSEDQTVYEPEGDDGGKEIGILKEISKEYHTINYNDKSYTVLIELSDKSKGKIYCCVLTDSLFDKKLNFIGVRTKVKNNEYRFDFTK